MPPICLSNRHAPLFVTLSVFCRFAIILLLAAGLAQSAAPSSFAQTLPGLPSVTSSENDKDKKAEGEAPANAAPNKEQAAAKEKAEAELPPLKTDPLYPAELVESAEQLSNEINRLQKGVERLQDSDEGLARQREAVEKVEGEARQLEEKLQGPLSEVTTQITRLGEPPKEGAEAATVVRERARLGRLKKLIEGAAKTANLTQLRARQLAGQIQTARLNKFARNLFEQQTSPLSPTFWSRILAYAPRIGAQLSTISGNWWDLAAPRSIQLIMILLASFMAYVGFRLLRDAIVQRFLTEPLDPRPPFFRRAGASLWITPLFALPGLAAISMIFVGFVLVGLTNSQITPILQQAWVAIAIYSGINALARTILLPHYPSWRLLGLHDEASHRFLFLTHAMVAAFSLDYFLGGLVRFFHFPIEIGLAITSFANIVFGVLMLGVVRIPLLDDDSRVGERLLKRSLRWLGVPLVLVGVAIVVSTLFGYIAFGRFMAGQVLLTVSGFVALMLCHMAIRALTSPVDPAASPNSFGNRVGIDLERRRQVAGILAVVLNSLLVLTALGLLLLSWGFSEAVLLSWVRALFFGFEIGQFRISLFRILVAIGLFVLVLFATRMLQAWLKTSVLSEQRVDVGIANSVDQGIGYAGMALAALIAISHVGLDVTNLAIVAGALSVGIGFGLQSIVNNFVSGLILLIERPVKVGDWIIVGTNEGIIRRISVRATEIETFDRASVIVPNSELITATVQNWTHRNAMGRVVVKIGASYSTDPEHVMDVLRRVGKECDLLLKFPEPMAVFEDFGASSLDFSLRGYVADVKKSLATRTELRTRIYQAFKAEGIEIPFPQQDVHLRDLDIVRAALRQAAEKRATNGSGDGEPQNTNVKTETAIQAGETSINEPSEDEGEGDAR